MYPALNLIFSNNKYQRRKGSVSTLGRALQAFDITMISGWNSSKSNKLSLTQTKAVENSKQQAKFLKNGRQHGDCGDWIPDEFHPAPIGRVDANVSLIKEIKQIQDPKSKT